MKFFILCFGRTDYTEATCRSIKECSGSRAEIILINNGWTEYTVPTKILDHWDHFKSKALSEGLVDKIITEKFPIIGSALSIFSKYCEAGDSDFYFISDNDCLVDSVDFDLKLIHLMYKYPSLHKLGIDFYHVITRKYADSFSHYLPSNVSHLDGQSTRVGESCINAFGEIGPCQEFLDSEGEICKSQSDTTISIVKKEIAISQHQYRWSYNASGLRHLHVGHLEELFWSSNELSVLEMIHYHRLRPIILTEFKEVYEKRLANYINNIKIGGHNKIINDYISSTNNFKPMIATS